MYVCVCFSLSLFLSLSLSFFSLFRFFLSSLFSLFDIHFGLYDYMLFFSSYYRGRLSLVAEHLSRKQKVKGSIPLIAFLIISVIFNSLFQYSSLSLILFIFYFLFLYFYLFLYFSFLSLLSVYLSNCLGFYVFLLLLLLSLIQNARSGVRTHASEENSTLNYRLRPLGHPCI